jgi:hypothetical protein
MHKDAMKLAGDKVHSLYLAESYCDEESETHFSIYTGFVTVSGGSYGDDDDDDGDDGDTDEPIALVYSCKDGKVKEFYESETKRDCVQEIKRKYPNAKKV